MPNFLHDLARHLAQRSIEAARADEEAGMQHDAVDLALEDAGAEQIEHAFDEQFAAAVEADVELFGVHRGVARRVVAEPRQQLAEFVVVALAQHQRLRHGLAQRADADLQRAAVGHDARRMQARGIVGERHRLARRREQRKIGRGVEHEIEFVLADRRVAGHERQFRIGLAGEQKIDAAVAAQRQQIERQVGIAAQAVGMRRFLGAMRHQLRHHVDAAVEHVAQRMGVVRARCNAAARRASRATGRPRRKIR